MSAPKLRFKEFDGHWGFKKIGDISECIVPGRNKPKLFDGDIPWVTTPDLKDKTYVSDTRSNYYISEEEAKTVGSKIVPENSVIMSCVGDLGLFAINTKPIVINQQLHAFILDDHKYSSIFILNALSKNQDYIEKVATKTALPYLNKDNCNSIPLFLCSFKEQTKIASFLSAVDEKISQLTQKHQLLSQYKQGMMQKLFSQQIRFKADDGSEFGEWEKLTLSQISKHIGGTALESYVSECGDYNFISIGNYSTNGKYIDNSQRIILNEKTGTKLLDKDDLVMVLNDKTATGDLIGSTILINEDNKYIYNQRSERIICNKSKVLSVYLWHFLNSEMMRSEVRKLAQGGTQIYINFSSVLSIIFLLPCLAEQNKIANFLSAIDQKIEVVAQQIEQAKQWKKGLLQQMFV